MSTLSESPLIEEEEDWESANIVLNIPSVKKVPKKKKPIQKVNTVETERIKAEETLRENRLKAEEHLMASLEQTRQENMLANKYSTTMSKMSKNNRHGFQNLLNQKNVTEAQLNVYLKDNNLVFLKNRK